MLNKKLIINKLKYFNLKKDTLIFFTLSTLLLIFNLSLKEYINENLISIFLLVFIIIFGLPHGALDTLVAKKFKLYKSVFEFTVFNMIYILIAVLVFIAWQNFSIFSLFSFLIISGYHFSEDWKQYNINIIERNILGFSIINLPLLFHQPEINIIYSYLTGSNIVYKFSNIQLIIAYINVFFLIKLMFNNYFSLNILVQSIIILCNAYLLEPIFFFITYFCFFHSVKNYKEASQLLEDVNKNKIRVIVILNTFFAILVGSIIYIYFLEDFTLKNISSLVFIGLASLTLPHMILRFLINFK